MPPIGNPARAELEREHGYEYQARHAPRSAHAHRSRDPRARELLVRRHDAAELIAIRDGALSFDELLATAAQLEHDMQRAAARTTLPEDVDHEQADRLPNFCRVDHELLVLINVHRDRWDPRPQRPSPPGLEFAGGSAASLCAGALAGLEVVLGLGTWTALVK
jgi:hypothetical protein